MRKSRGGKAQPPERRIDNRERIRWRVREAVKMNGKRVLEPCKIERIEPVLKLIIVLAGSISNNRERKTVKP
jgi:hypothetical protein